MYGYRSNGNKHGDVFTSPEIVHYMLDLVGYTSDRNLSELNVIEPSSGEGEFVIAIIARLSDSADKFGFNLNDAINRNIVCFDIDKEKIKACIERIHLLYPNLKFSDHVFINNDFLTANTAQADLIIGNPPYVRHEQIPEGSKMLYRKLFSTFKYRADLYIPFFEKSLKLLRPGGKHCFICSNRWLKNQYGYELRNLISSSFNLQKIINLEKVKAFQEKVLAYPAISLIKNESSGKSFDYSDINDLDELESLSIERYPMPHNGDWSDTFNIVSGRLKLSSIEELGFKIGIGVATGADKIYIGKHLVHLIEEELLLPILTSKDIKNNNLNWNGNYVFNPFDDEGNMIDLSKYPKAQSYMESHKEKLQRRHISQRNPDRWYRTIDKIHKDLVSKPKIILPDISANNQILIDYGHFYPHHNLYYIVGGDINGLKILSAMLMSDFVITQLSRLGNNMNGGYPRWQSQYVRKLKLPDMRTLSTSYSESLISYYESNNIEGINSVINRIIA